MKEAVKTEARRIARRLVKDELKRQGVKVSWVEASEINKAVGYLLKEEPSIYKQAAKEIRNRSRRKIKVDISKLPRRKK